MFPFFPIIPLKRESGGPVHQLLVFLLFITSCFYLLSPPSLPFNSSFSDLPLLLFSYPSSFLKQVEGEEEGGCRGERASEKEEIGFNVKLSRCGAEVEWLESPSAAVSSQKGQPVLHPEAKFPRE